MTLTLLHKRLLALLPILFLCVLAQAQPDTPYVQHFPRGNASSIDSFRGSVEIDKDFYLGRFAATRGQYVLTPGWRGYVDTLRVSDLVGLYALLRVDLTVGVDIDSNTTGSTTPVALIQASSKYFPIEDYDIMSIVCNNIQNQQASVVDTNKIDFSASGGLFSGIVTILYRRKL